MLKNRYLTKIIVEELADKMVFLGGPRQVGKTTLARELVAREFSEIGYYNWDKRADRRQMLSSNWPGNATLIILDEIHKKGGGQLAPPMVSSEAWLKKLLISPTHIANLCSIFLTTMYVLAIWKNCGGQRGFVVPLARRM
jgi:predicted AAA+ superfamily ATPase